MRNIWRCLLAITVCGSSFNCPVLATTGPQFFPFSCPAITPDVGVDTTTSLVNIPRQRGLFATVVNSSKYPWEVGGGVEYTGFGSKRFKSFSFDYLGPFDGSLLVILIGTDSTGNQNWSWFYFKPGGLTGSNSGKGRGGPSGGTGTPSGFQLIEVTPSTPVSEMNRGTTLSTVNEIQLYFMGQYDLPNGDPNVERATMGNFKLNGKALPALSTQIQACPPV